MNFCVLLLVYKDRIWRLHVSKFDKKVIPRWKMSQLISLSSFFPAADTLLSIWGVWGANQILLSLFYLAVVTRYRGLLPFAILLFTLEFWSGILVGDLLGKKVTSKRTPPGNMAKWTISLIVGPVLFWMSLPHWYGILQMIFFPLKVFKSMIVQFYNQKVNLERYLTSIFRCP